METTIAVRESTAQLLARMKKKAKARSMDELIIEIVRKTENLPSSRFGSQPHLKEFREEERAHIHDI